MVQRTEDLQTSYSGSGRHSRRLAPRVQFGSEPFPENPSLDRTMRQLEQAVNFQSFSNDHVPSEGSQYVSGTEDRPWADVQTRRLGVTGTCTMRAGVLVGREKFVFECATNSALIIIPVYTTGSSPYDIWHPSSGYYRDGAIWMQKASPAKYFTRAMGVDRLMGIWDTTTCTHWGSAVWVRDCEKRVAFTEHQFEDDQEMWLSVGGGYFIETTTVGVGTAGVTGTALVANGLLGASLVGGGLMHSEMGYTPGGSSTTTVAWIKPDGSAFFSGNLEVNGSSQLGTDDNHMAVESDGDVTFVGTSGLVFGSMYNHDTSTTVTITDIGVAVRIQSGFAVGQVNGTTFGNSRELTVSVAGKYKIDWSISFSMIAGSNQEIEGTVMVDNSPDDEATAHRHIGTGSDTGAMGGTCILDLAADAVVSLGVRNETSTNNVSVDHANMAIVQVGG